MYEIRKYENVFQVMSTRIHFQITYFKNPKTHTGLCNSKYISKLCNFQIQKDIMDCVTEYFSVAQSKHKHFRSCKHLCGDTRKNHQVHKVTASTK